MTALDKPTECAYIVPTNYQWHSTGLSFQISSRERHCATEDYKPVGSGSFCQQLAVGKASNTQNSVNERLNIPLYNNSNKSLTSYRKVRYCNYEQKRMRELQLDRNPEDRSERNPRPPPADRRRRNRPVRRMPGVRGALLPHESQEAQKDFKEVIDNPRNRSIPSP